MKSNLFKKYAIILGLLLSQQALIGVGFSSWLIYKDNVDKVNVQGTIYADDVFDSLPYVSMNTSKGDAYLGFTNLKVNSKGFVNDGVVSYSSSVTYYLAVNMSKFYNENPNFNFMKVLFELSMKNSNSSLLNYVSSSSSSVKYLFSNDSSYTSSLSTLPASFNKTQSSVSSTLSLNNFDRITYSNNYSGNYLFLEVTYSFVTDSSSYGTLYSTLVNNDSSLLFNVSVEGVMTNEA